MTSDRRRLQRQIHQNVIFIINVVVVSSIVSLPVSVSAVLMFYQPHVDWNGTFIVNIIIRHTQR